MWLCFDLIISNTSSIGFLFSRNVKYTFAILRSSVTFTLLTVSNPASKIKILKIKILAKIFLISSPTLLVRLNGLLLIVIILESS